jgi:arsenite-transporting ATPase
VTTTSLGKAPIDQIIGRRKVIVTCGTGGVGKTTLSAAIALRASLQGKRTVVITIDPAKRLITSLGLHEAPPETGPLGDRPTDLTALVRQAIGKTGYPVEMKGTLEAIVPDTRHTFETFIRELSPSPAVAERVMNNPIFQIFAKEFSGTNEYMAMEKLYGLLQQDRYDCIILDTPPSRNTLAFLTAPKLLVQFFEERMIKWLVLPANKLVSAGMRKALGILESLTGAGFMTHLFEFAAGLFEIRARFAANLNSIMHTLESNQVGFIMVTTPAPDFAPEASHFIETLQNLHFNFDGVAVNRSLGYLRMDQEKDLDLKDTVGQPSESKSEEHRSLKIIAGLKERERLSLEGRFEGKRIPLCGLLPELARDVHSVEDLLHVAMAFDGVSTSSSDA